MTSHSASGLSCGSQASNAVKQHPPSNMSSAKPSHKRELVYALNPNDVLLGRGQHAKQEGNQRFVALVRSRVREYNSVDSQAKTAKDLVARQIIKDVEALGGRFVRKVEDSSVAAAAAAGVSEYEDVWEIADRATVLVKIKQTFRDYSVIRRKAAAAAATAVATNGNAASAMPSPKPKTPASQRQPNNLTPVSDAIDGVESMAALENHASMTSPNEGHSLPQFMPDSVRAGLESHSNNSATLLQQLLLLQQQQQQQQASASQPLLQSRDALMLPPEFLLQLLNHRGLSTAGANPSLGRLQNGSLGATGALPPPSSPLAQSSSYQLMNAAALAEARVNAAFHSNHTHQSDDDRLRQMAGGILSTDRLELMQRQLLIQRLMSSFSTATATTTTTASQPNDLFPPSVRPAAAATVPSSSLSSVLWPQSSRFLDDNILDSNLSTAASSSDLAQILARLAPTQNSTRAAAADSSHVNGASSFDCADMERKPSPRQRRPDP